MKEIDPTDDEAMEEEFAELMAEVTGKSKHEIRESMRLHDEYMHFYEMLNFIFQNAGDWIPYGAKPITFLKVPSHLSIKRYIEQDGDGWKLVTQTLTDVYTYESDQFSEVATYALENPCTDYGEMDHTV